MSNPIVERVKANIRQRIRDDWKAIKKMAPEGTDAGRIVNIAVSAIEMNPKIAQCSFDSIVEAVMLAATVGIEPNDGTGRAWFIPRKNRCCYELGFKGHVDLMYKSGRIECIDGHAVFEHDTFNVTLGTEPRIEHKPAMNSRGVFLGAYAVVWISNSNRPIVEVITSEDMAKIQAASPAKSGPWKEWPEEMARAKALRRISKRAPIDATARRAIGALDEAESRIPVEQVLDDPWSDFKAKKPEKNGKETPKESPKPDLGIHADEPPDDWQPSDQELFNEQNRGPEGH